MLSSFSIAGERLDSLDLKVLILTEGIGVNDQVYTAYGSTHRISRDPVQCNVLFLPDQTAVHLGDMGSSAPFQLVLGPDRSLRLLYRGNFVTEVFLPKATAFYRQHTSRGTAFHGMAVLQGYDVIAFPYLWPCEFAKAGLACKFCHCGNYTQQQSAAGVQQDVVFAPRDVAEAIHYAVTVEKCAKHVQITGGSTFNTNGECDRVLEILHTIDELVGLENIPGEIILYTTPPSDPMEVDKLFNAGVDRIACDIEIWNEELAKEICPGKSKVISRQRSLDALEHIARTYGPGKACSTFVVGLEPAEDFLAAAEYLASRGIVPIPSVWMRQGLPPVDVPVKTDLNFFRKVKRGLAGIYAKYQCQPPGDLGFNVCLCRDTWNHCAEILAMADACK